MNDNVRKVFDILGIEPNEKFKIEDFKEYVFYFDERLRIVRVGENIGSIGDIVLRGLLDGTFKIIKIPKRKKLRDLTEKEYDKWKKEICFSKNLCNEECIFYNVGCDYNWIRHKDLYSDKFLDQEIEVE